MGFLRGRFWVSLWSNVMHFSQKPCERSGSWARKKRQGSFLVWAGCQLRQKRTCSPYLQPMCVPWETLGTWTVGFRNLFYPTDPRNNDRLTHARKHAKKLFDFRKSLHVQRLGDVYESQGLVCFLEHRDFDDPGTEDLINEFRGCVGPEACRRTAPGYAHGQVLTHGQTLLFYII